MQAISHEYWHIFQTYFKNGREDTPPNTSGATNSRGTHQRNVEGEAGEFGERALYGGVVNFYPDLHLNGDLTFENEHVGFPWRHGSDGYRGRVTMESLIRLVHAEWQDSGNASMPLLDQDEAIPRIRHQVNMPRHRGTQAFVNLRADVPGRNVGLRTLRVYTPGDLTVTT